MKNHLHVFLFPPFSVNRKLGANEARPRDRKWYAVNFADETQPLANSQFISFKHYKFK